MLLRLLRWGMLLLGCCASLAWAAPVPMRLTPLTQPPELPPAQATPPLAAPGTETTTRAWLHAPYGRVDWLELRLTQDWSLPSPPVLALGANQRARVVVYAPPDYRPQIRNVFDAEHDPSLSRRANVFPLPPDLRADQPIYLALGELGQAAPLWATIEDETAYRARDLNHVRISTFLAAVQVSMLLVILCFWVVLRDRAFLHFVLYELFQVLYAMGVSGELYTLPGAAILSPLGFHPTQCLAGLAGATSVWFVLEFAELRSYVPRLAFWLGLTRWPMYVMAGLLWIPFLQPDRWWSPFNNMVLLIATILALSASWVVWRSGGHRAGVFLLSWLPLLLLLLIRVVQMESGLPAPEWLEYGFPASMAYGAVIIAVGLAERTLQARRERDVANRIAHLDPLTGIHNRRALMEHLHETWHAAPASGASMAVLFLDLDHFKRINDTWGHAAGDACIIAVADAIRAELGADDCVGRYGGEEFLVLLQGASADGAPGLAERIRARAAALRIKAGSHLISLTVSVGYAVRDVATANVSELVEHADQAQYQAKSDGRNRVVGYHAGPATGGAAVLAGRPRMLPDAGA